MNRIKLLDIPFDFGQDHVGVRLAGTYLKEKGLIDHLSETAHVLDSNEFNFPFKRTGMYGSLIKHKLEGSALNRQISGLISSLDLTSTFLLNIGGDHGMGLGTVHGMLEHDPETIVVWADAHGDINTPESSPTGNFHGMPLSFLLGIAKDPAFSWMTRRLLPRHLILFGPRDLDPFEKDLIEKFNIQYFSSEEINRIGAKEIIDMALNRIDPYGTKPLHLSLDVDLFDQKDIKSTGTIVSMGPRQEEVFLMGGILAETGRLKSMDIVEFNPLIGSEEDADSSGQLVLAFIRQTVKHVFSNSRKILTKESPLIFA